MKNLLIQIIFILASINLALGQQGDPKATEVWTPEPPVVHVKNGIPSDAVILFDGKNLDEWQKVLAEEEMVSEQKVTRDSAPWKVENGYFEVVPQTGGIETKKVFGDIQIHLEWNPPVMQDKEGQGYSNSGLFFMGRYELQILNSYENKTYVNGMAGSIYKQHRPLANPANPPGAWQTYDAIFTAPRFGTDGKLISPAYITAIFNGVLVQNHSEVKGSTVYIGEPSYTPHKSKLPLMLQDHGDKIRFRNVWVREIE